MRYIQIILLALVLLCSACTANHPTINTGKVADEMNRSPKRGVAYNFHQMNDIMAMSPYISWNYNWGNTIGYDLMASWFDQNDIDFCPMCWNGNYSTDKIRQYVSAHPNTQYLLAFNEPNLTDQANMTPSQAAALWAPVVALAKELNLKLVSPAMNYGTLAGYSDPIKWLDEFFAQPGVTLDDIDAISLHCYMGSSVALMSFVDRFDKYGKPIWMTEFCAWESNIGSANAQMQYMSEVLNYFEQSEKIERYSWFIPRYKTEGTHPYMQLFKDSNSDLTDLGKVYCHFSSFDKSVYLRTPLDASQYVELNDYKVHIAPSTDPVDAANGNALMIYALTQGQSVGYQIAAESPTNSIVLRYASYGDNKLTLSVDGELQGLYTLPKTGDMNTWSDFNVSTSVPAGNHELKIEQMDGTMHLSKIILK